MIAEPIATKTMLVLLLIINGNQRQPVLVNSIGGQTDERTLTVISIEPENVCSSDYNQTSLLSLATATLGTLSERDPNANRRRSN